MFFCIAALTFSLFSVSAYSQSGTTASSVQTRPGVAACGQRFDFGTRFMLPDGRIVTCMDRGGLVDDDSLDIFMPDINDAWAWGRREQRVGVIWERCGG